MCNRAYISMYRCRVLDNGKDVIMDILFDGLIGIVCITIVGLIIMWIRDL